MLQAGRLPTEERGGDVLKPNRRRTMTPREFYRLHDEVELRPWQEQLLSVLEDNEVEDLVLIWKRCAIVAPRRPR